jgi:hypothetical protein
MTAAISEGSCDIIGIGRPACLEPHLPKDKMLAASIPDDEAVVQTFVIRDGTFWRRLPLVGMMAESVSYPTSPWKMSINGCFFRRGMRHR